MKVSYNVLAASGGGRRIRLLVAEPRSSLMKGVCGKSRQETDKNAFIEKNGKTVSFNSGYYIAKQDTATMTGEDR